MNLYVWMNILMAISIARWPHLHRSLIYQLMKLNTKKTETCYISCLKLANYTILVYYFLLFLLLLYIYNAEMHFNLVRTLLRYLIVESYQRYG